MREGLEGEYKRAYFNHEGAVTAHKIHDKGKLFHDTHSKAWRDIQEVLEEYHKLLDSYKKLTEAYMKNSALPEGLYNKGFHQFVQLFPNINDATVDNASNIHMNNDDKVSNIEANLYNFNSDLEYTTVGGTSSQCKATYWSGKGNPQSTSKCSRQPLTKEQFLNLHYYYDSGFKNNDSTTPKTSVSAQYVVEKNGDKNGDFKPSMPNIDSDLIAANHMYYVGYAGPAPAPTSADTASSPPGNSKIFGETESRLLDEFNQGSWKTLTTDVHASGTQKAYYRYNDFPSEQGQKRQERLLIEAVPPTPNSLTLNEPSIGKGIIEAGNTIYYREVPDIVLKFAKKNGNNILDANGTTITLPSGKTPEYIQIYDTYDGTTKSTVGYAMSSPILTDFVKNDFAVNSGSGTGSTRGYTRSSIRLYAAIKTAQDKDVHCGVISDKDSKSIIRIKEANDNIATVSSSSLTHQTFSKAWCDVTMKINNDLGQHMEALQKIIQVVGRYLQMEMYLFDLYQRGTVVEKPSDGTSIFKEIPNPTPDANENHYIVFPKIKDAIGISNKIDIPNLQCPTETVVNKYCGSTRSGNKSNYILIPYTQTNLDDLKDYSSGARFKGLTEDAFQKASDALLESYKTVEHDVKELNKIKALQTDVSILGNMQYYRMIIYAVVLFFLLVSVYYIHAAS